MIENDATAAAIGEEGLGGSRSSFATVYMAGGIGAGVVLGGQPYRGATSNGVELGHISIDAFGPACSCGNRGCVENIAGPTAVVLKARSNPALADRLRLRGDTVADFERIARGAKAGDAEALAILEESAAVLGTATVSLVNLFDVDKVVIAGAAFATAGPLYRDAAQAAVDRSAFMRFAHPVVVTLADHVSDAAAIGGAVTVLRRLFEARSCDERPARGAVIRRRGGAVVPRSTTIASRALTIVTVRPAITSSSAEAAAEPSESHVPVHHRQRRIAQLALRGVVPRQQRELFRNGDAELARGDHACNRRVGVVEDDRRRTVIRVEQCARAGSAAVGAVVAVDVRPVTPCAARADIESACAGRRVQQDARAAHPPDASMTEPDQVGDGVVHRARVVDVDHRKTASATEKDRGKAELLDDRPTRGSSLDEVDQDDAVDAAVLRPSAVVVDLLLHVVDHPKQAVPPSWARRSSMPATKSL